MSLPAFRFFCSWWHLDLSCTTYKRNTESQVSTHTQNKNVHLSKGVQSRETSAVQPFASDVFIPHASVVPLEVCDVYLALSVHGLRIVHSSR